jgi:hypothetical protein
MADVTPLRRCRRCGEAAKPVDLDYRGEVFATIDVCDACVDETNAELARMRTVFDAMVVAGVSRELANETMTYMLRRLAEEQRKAAERVGQLLDRADAVDPELGTLARARLEYPVGMPVWYRPSLVQPREFAAIVDESPRMLGTEVVVRLRDLEPAYARVHHAPFARTTVAAAHIEHVRHRVTT